MYWLQMVALSHVSAFTVNLSYNLEPVYSIAIAILFLGEARGTSIAAFGLDLDLLPSPLFFRRSLSSKNKKRLTHDTARTSLVAC